MKQDLGETRRQFISFWGEMASSWGVSRTMAQIYALLFSTSDAMDTDEIMTELEISRGNANMNLHKLLNWGLVHKVNRADTRKDYFEAEKDIWELTRNIILKRQQLELKPVTDSLAEIAESLKEGETPTEELSEQDYAFYKNLYAMAEFLELFNEMTSRLTPLLENKDVDQVRNLIQLLKTSQPAEASSQEGSNE
jgi:DNA-binding transcriptional regulator GbsR (MarR family)